MKTAKRSAPAWLFAYAALLMFCSVAVLSALPTRTSPPAQLSRNVTPSDAKAELTNIERALELLERLLKIGAYALGGFWVYFNYLKGRIYRPRLEVKLSGEYKQVGTVCLLKLAIQVKNVGLSKVDIQETGTALRVFVHDASSGESWQRVATLPLLENHNWIEPGETVEEGKLLPDVKGNIFKAVAYLSSRRKFLAQSFPPRRKKIMWVIEAYIT